MTRFRPTLTSLDDRIVPTLLPDGFSESLLAGGLNSPTSMAVAPDGRVFIAEQAGILRVIKDGELLSTPFATIQTDTSSECGLLGLTLDPDFANNGYVYIYHTVPGTTEHGRFNRISRFTASGDTAALGSETPLFDLDPMAYGHHIGGPIRFGPDGKLYILVGDDTDANNAQSVTNHFGKVLRINPDGTIPSDNPTAVAGIPGTSDGAHRAIWAAGLRNPFGLAFEPGTGRLLIHDVGGAVAEEINEGAPGRNYGWHLTEGDFDPAAFPDYTRPLYAYPHVGDPLFVGECITGGAFYAPARQAFPREYAGDYFFTDLTGGWINRLDSTTGEVTNFASDLTGEMPVALSVAPNGDLLYLTWDFRPGGGAVYRISHEVDADPLPVIVAAGSGAGSDAVVTVFDAVTGEERTRLPAFEPGFTGGVRVTTADVTGDQVADIIAGAGPGGGPHVKVFDGVTGAVVRDFFAFEPTFTGGVYVAAADFDGDGFADVAVSADVGGGPRVRVLSGSTGETIADFFALETTFTGGTRVSTGDVTADRVPDLVVSAGFGGGPRVAVFDGASVAAGSPTRQGADFFAYEDTLRNGTFVSAADFDNDGFADLVTGAGPGGAPRVTVFSGQEFLAGRQTRLADFFAGDTGLREGVTVAVADANGDDLPELVAAPVGGAGRVTAYHAGDATSVREFDAFPGFAGAVFVG
ncbi:MAG TPA: PQQ-dependent sugar dehydrogenase [Gemmataceae bacterium]|nr:PQQ-dependent sugar dehydrogenase [Gemmataceae bacterium]